MLVVEVAEGEFRDARSLRDDYGSSGVLLQDDIVCGHSFGEQVAKNFIQCLPVGQPRSLNERIQHHIEVRRVVGSFIGDGVGVWVAHERDNSMRFAA